MAFAVQGEHLVQTSTSPWTAQWRRLALMLVTVAMAVALISIEAPIAMGKSPTSSDPAKRTDAARILKIARAQIGHKFKMGTEGRKYFDCSGFVYFVYRQAGLVSRIGGGRMGVTSYLHWAQRRGLASKNNPRPGDLIVWGKHGKIHHMGIYISGNRAISALINPWGVRTHSIGGIGLHVMAYIHTRITR